MNSAHKAFPSVLLFTLHHLFPVKKLQQFAAFLDSSLAIYPLELTDFRDYYEQVPFILATRLAAKYHS